jgi:uncharacterized circularly permuted ATP-grasp superfamily protein/uncharacterized alpha-E superfamily protein
MQSHRASLFDIFATKAVTGSAAEIDAWKQFFELENITSTVLDERKRDVDHHILRDGITHNVYGDGAFAMRPWSLEILPALIHPEPWAQLEAGIIQRATLLQHMLADFYGPQRLLQDGLIPGALLERHPGYIPSLHGHTPPLGLWLHVVAFDVIKNPLGQWCVVAQRTQSPSGLGYVLHNRLLISRQFPAAYSAMHIQHIASTYRQLLLTLEESARTVALKLDGTATPKIVLWTPGPYNETYFEHAYLARYLGLPLVEGADLTMRHERLYLKTLNGLELIHGIFRRVDEDWTDPLELKPQSQLGVPGLLQVLRAGHLAMTNALGVGVLESPAINGFLPAIARTLLHEDLQLTHTDTWWCGEASALAHVMNSPDDWILQSTFPQAGLATQVYGPISSQTDSIQDDPQAYVAQRPQAFDTTPVWRTTGLSLQPSIMRVYAICDASGDWRVLPGGMVRTTSTQAPQPLSMQRGGASTDAWVLSPGNVDSYSMLQPRLKPRDLHRRRSSVAARTGENLYWIGRYTERIEQALPLLRWALRLTHHAEPISTVLSNTCFNLCVQYGLVAWNTPHLYDQPLLFEQAIFQQAFDSQAQQGAQGLGYSLANLEQSAQQLRERLSLDHWRFIRMAVKRAQRAQRLHLQPSGPARRQALLIALDQLALLMGSITGAQSDRMTRDQGWRLLTLGRLSERLLALCQYLRQFLSVQAHTTEAGLDTLLELTDSTITFRSRYQRHEDLLPVADILIFDAANPRSIAGVILSLRQEIHRLPGELSGREALLNLLPRSGVGISINTLADWIEQSNTSASLRLADHLQDLSCEAFELAHVLGQHYFMPTHQVDHVV